MVVLVDYDNIEKNFIRLGISFVVSSIISKIDARELAPGARHVTVRLYGGWYQNTNFTVRAQKLSIEIADNFPSPMFLSDSSTSVIVKCEMAYSLLADPRNHLFHTFRSRSVPEGLKAEHPGMRGCTEVVCPIIETHNFITNNICSKCGTMKPEDIFYRGEQKLVDTMLTSDLIFSSKPASSLCVVSSDDDLWPGIATTLRLGSRIVHVHAKTGASTPAIYTRFAGAGYIQRNL